MAPRARSLIVTACVAVTLVLAGLAGRRDFARQGDGWEYLLMVEAWVRHGSPDIRAGDVEAVAGAVDRWLQVTSGPTVPGAVRGVVDSELENRFATTPAGRTLPVHFWLYPLVSVPARLVIDALGGWSFNALVVTNVLLVGLAIGTVLAAAGSGSRRHALAALLLASPIVWYTLFTGGEVFSWALGVMALVALDRGHTAVSAALAGLGAAQNPAMAPLALVPVLRAFSDGGLRGALRTGVFATLGLLPVADHLWHFGRPGVLLAENASLAGVSASRAFGLLTDLNTGLLPYVPVLLLAVPVAAWTAWRERHARLGWLLLAFVLMLTLAQTQMNWNSGGMGLHRYLVWMLPVLTWFVVDGWPERTRARLAVAAVATSVAVLVDWPAETNWLEHRPVARWVLRHAPALYRPEFEVFAERAAHAEAPPGWMRQGRTDGWRELLPVAVGDRAGAVTTLLVDRDSVSRLDERFSMTPGYRAELVKRATAARVPIYVHPPPGAMRARVDPIDGAYYASMQAAARVREQPSLPPSRPANVSGAARSPRGRP